MKKKVEQKIIWHRGEFFAEYVTQSFEALNLLYQQHQINRKNV